MYVPSFNFVTLTVLEKRAMKIYLMRMDRMANGRIDGRQGKFTFSKLSYN